MNMSPNDRRTVEPAKALAAAAFAASLVWAAPVQAEEAGSPETANVSEPQDTLPKVKMTKREKAEKAAELAPTMTAMVADPEFPAIASADFHVDVEVVVYMGGFHLSTLTFTTAFNDTGYEIRSNVRTKGIVDALIKTNAVMGARGIILDRRTAPLLYNSDITDRNQRQLVAISYASDEGINTPTEVLSFPEYDLEKYPVSLLERQHSVDPMSAIMQIILGARLDSEKPCGGTIPVFDGRRRFNLIMEYRDTEEISTGKGDAWSGEALKCWIGFKRVAGYKPRKPRASDRTDGLSEWPDIYMWLAPVKGPGTVVYMPVRFFAKTRFGAVIARATKLESGSSAASGGAQHAEAVHTEENLADR